jgi:EmrB/QacA subfamily drug resistance transporter
MVNVAIPALARELHASDSHLQWIVDSFNLVFGALLISAGSISDRFGRKQMLIAGMALFGIASYAGGLANNWSELIISRSFMGLGAAMCFPATLSILTNVFKERKEKAAAIGIWGAATGMAIALGPISGGWLIEHFTWNSIFYAMGPVGLLSVLMSSFFVPNSKDPLAHRIDLAGLVLAAATMATLVYTIIEAPTNGWLSGKSLTGFGVAIVLLTLFILQEIKTDYPMLDIRIFSDMRFSAASLAITVGFFALFGFTFLVVQYFQVVKGYAPLATGFRVLPVAVTFALGAVLGTRFAVKFGNKVIVTLGLGLVTVFYLWISHSQSVSTSYLTIAGEMVLMGTGMGLMSTSATESIMGSVSEAKAGVGSAVNETARLVGGTLGLAVIGSVYDSIYVRGLHRFTDSHLPALLSHTASKSIQGAYGVAQGVSNQGNKQLAHLLITSANDAFMHAFRVSCLSAGVFVAVGALISLKYLPAHPSEISDNKDKSLAG